MKCLEKDRARRYETANGLAQDIERHLKQEPVLARPPSAAYRVQKFVRRNKVMVGAAATVALALVMGVAGISWQWQRARRERGWAEANAYAADMNLAQQALLNDDLGKARTLLARYRRGSGLEHLRGFEWRCLAAEAVNDYALADSSSSNYVARLALSQDGRTLAVSRFSGSIELRDPISLRLLATLETNAGHCVGVCFSPAGRLLTAAAPRGAIRLWELDPLRVVGDLACTNEVTLLTFSPDGRHLASRHPISGVNSGIVRVWDLENRQMVWSLEVPTSDDANGVPICFSPDGSHLAVGHDSGQIRIWDWAGDRVVVTITAHSQPVTALAYSPDGKLLASGSGFNPEDIRLWDPATGQPAGSFPGHRGWMCGLQFSGDGRRLLSVSGDQTIGIWDVPARRPIQRLRGHLDEVWSLALDERRAALITGCKDGTLARWDIDKVRPHGLRVDLPTLGRCPCYADGGAAIAVLDEHGAVALWRPSDSQHLAVIAALGTNNIALATAPARSLLACVKAEGAVQIWSLRSATLVTSLPWHGDRIVWRDGLRFSKREDCLVAFSESGRVTLWDAQTWTQCCSFAETNGASRAAFSPDGRLLVLGARSGLLEWWDVVATRWLGQTSCQSLGVTGLDFSPDGQTLASANEAGYLTLWDAKTRRVAARWKGDPMALPGVAFSPDGTRLATGLAGGRAARLWDLRTRRELLTLSAPGQFFLSVAFSADGDGLLCGDYEGHSYLWRAPPFAELDSTR